MQLSEKKALRIQQEKTGTHTHTHVTEELTKKPKIPPKNSKNSSSCRGAYREDLEDLT
jgi:hypothetical protein